jgi:hypothetical protein
MPGLSRAPNACRQNQKAIAGTAEKGTVEFAPADIETPQAYVDRMRDFSAPRDAMNAAREASDRDQLFPRRAYARAFEALLAGETRSTPVGSWSACLRSRLTAPAKLSSLNPIEFDLDAGRLPF